MFYLIALWIKMTIMFHHNIFLFKFFGLHRLEFYPQQNKCAATAVDII